jgi:chemotaxis protein methyltransferase CheR
MTNTTAAGALSASDFKRLTDWFYKRTGIQFAESKRYFVDKRVSACIEESGAAGFADWFGRIRLAGESALELALINRLTVHETYFMREDYQLHALVNSVLPNVMAGRSAADPVRILSVPCSTGDEAYSIAIWLLECWPLIETVDVEIAALDIDAASVQAARQGVYSRRAVQRLDPELLRRYFEPPAGADGTRRISGDLRGAVSFSVGNLCDPAEMRSLRDFDVIFCRNLLIYFDERSARRAAENLYGMLRPGGFLLLGHSESMSRISSIFEPVRFPETTAYRRDPEDLR